LILQEAGGKVTDLDGGPVDFGRGRRLQANRGLIVARTAAVHARVLAAVQHVLGESTGE
jgi:3'(2'), 5'-bisphosphate nucleotidase